MPVAQILGPGANAQAWSISLAELAARTTTAAGTADQVPPGIRIARFQLVVTAVAGTNPTLDVIIQDSNDGANWFTVGTFAQKTAVSGEAITITSLFFTNARASWTIGGTGSPSFTFKVDGVGTRPN